MTDQQWQLIRPLLPAASACGKRRGIDLRKVLNATRYLARAGYGAYAAFSPWAMADRLLMVPAGHAAVPVHHPAHVVLVLDREGVGREARPTAGMLDGQTVKSPHAAGDARYGAAKRSQGRRRRIAMDADGRLLMVDLTAADVQDAAGAEPIVKAVRKCWP